MPAFVEVIGRLGADPELRYVGDRPVVKFNVACDEYRNKETVTDWYTCQLWGDTAERAAQVLKKGYMVRLSDGKRKDREYNGKTYTDWDFSNFTFIPTGKKNNRDDD